MSTTEKKFYFVEGYRAGEKHEQKRIIKRLENELGIGVDLEDTEVRDSIIELLIALIKGEQK